MKRKIINIPGLILSLLLCYSQWAQAISDGDYQIEIICFENVHSSDDDAKSYVGSIDTRKAVRLNSESAIVSSVMASERALNNEIKIIQQSPNHRFIFANGWKQYLKEQVRSVPIYLTGGKEFNNKAEIEGLVSVKPIKNLFHTNVDIIFRKKDGSSLKEYRLTQVGRLKAKEAYYFDDPAFGALVIVTPINN